MTGAGEGSQGVPARELSDEELERQGTYAHATRTWVLLHADCDWRWPLAGGLSHWYPRARLFHQRRAWDWAGVIDDVRDALCELDPVDNLRTSVGEGASMHSI